MSIVARIAGPARLDRLAGKIFIDSPLRLFYIMEQLSYSIEQEMNNVNTRQEKENTRGLF